MNQWPAIMNIGGLVIDMIGVIGLFFTTAKGISQIQPPRSFPSIEYQSRWTGGNAMTKAFQEITKNINAVIQASAKEHKDVQKRANYWLIPIVVGFTLQLVAAVWQYCISLN